jgi:DNA-directed RNA polymerase specialized sigma24 family protein
MYKSRTRKERVRNRFRLFRAGNREINDNERELLTAKIWLERAFRAISAEEKALVALYNLEGWSIGELAGMYDRPEGTIKARLSRARRKMREELKKYLSDKNTKKVEAEYALPRCKTSAK